MEESPAGPPKVGCPRPTNINVIFALTVLPHEPALLRRGRRLVGSEPDARDLVQETMERALRTFHAFRPGTAVWAWLRTIMNSVWIDGWRRRQAAAKICSLPTIDMAGPDPEPPGSESRDEEILERLPGAIARLPPIFRQVLELRLQGNCSYGEIAERLGIPSRTVGTRILRARRQLRAILEAQIAEPAARPPKRAPSDAGKPVLPFAGHAVTPLRPRPARKAAALAPATGRQAAPPEFLLGARAAAQ
jgi:RNA polymerase sigma-70 factor (ECF subfamily)